MSLTVLILQLFDLHAEIQLQTKQTHRLFPCFNCKFRKAHSKRRVSDSYMNKPVHRTHPHGIATYAKQTEVNPRWRFLWTQTPGSVVFFNDCNVCNEGMQNLQGTQKQSISKAISFFSETILSPCEKQLGREDEHPWNAPGTAKIQVQAARRTKPEITSGFGRGIGRGTKVIYFDTLPRHAPRKQRRKREGETERERKKKKKKRERERDRETERLRNKETKREKREEQREKKQKRAGREERKEREEKERKEKKNED